MNKKVLLIVAIILVLAMLASLIIALVFEIRNDDSGGASGSSSSGEMNISGTGGSGDQTATDSQSIAGAYVAGTGFSEKYCTWEYMVESYELNIDSETPYYSEAGKELCAPGDDVIVPDDVTYVASFDANSIVFPETTTSIGSVYDRCYAIYIRAKTPPELIGGLQGMAMSEPPTIYVPIGYGEIYKTAERWSVYADYIVEGEADLSAAVDAIPEIKDYIWTVETSEGTFDFDTRKNYVDFSFKSYSNLYYSTLEDPEIYKNDSGMESNKEDVAIVGNVIRFYHPYYFLGFTLDGTEAFSGEVFAFFYRTMDEEGNYSGRYGLIDGTGFSLSGKLHVTGHVQTDPEVDLNGIIVTNDDSSRMYYDIYLDGLDAAGRDYAPLPSRIELYLFCGTKR